jgi:hypothetical protein
VRNFIGELEQSLGLVAHDDCDHPAETRLVLRVEPGRRGAGDHGDQAKVTRGSKNHDQAGSGRQPARGLCRPYFKGRDWYDFNWYIRQNVSPNLPHLQNALVQYGPWEGQENLVIDAGWV